MSQVSKRVGISGAGYIVPFHIRGWQQVGVDIIAIADPDKDRASARAAEFGIPNVYGSLEEMLATEQLDILDVASPRQLHVAQAKAGVALGLAVMCQKPVAPTLAEAQELAGVVEPDSRLMIHENWRFRREYRTIGSWIEAGHLGDIRHAAITMRTSAMLPDNKGIRPVERRQPFMLTEPRLLMAEVLIHNIDAMRSLIGDMELLHASARRALPDIVGETSASLLLQSASGFPVAISGDMASFGAPPGATDEIEIIGSMGRAVYRDETITLHGSKQEVIDNSGRDHLADCAARTIAHFVSCLDSGEEFETNLHDNLKTLELVEQAYTAANAG